MIQSSGGETSKTTAGDPALPDADQENEREEQSSKDQQNLPRFHHDPVVLRSRPSAI